MHKDTKHLLLVSCGVLLVVLVLPVIANILVIRNHHQYLRTMHRIDTLADALHRYRDAHGVYPATQPATQLVQTLGFRNYPELPHDAWGHEFRYESTGCLGCGFFLGSPGSADRNLQTELASYASAEVPDSHTVLICSDKGWVVYPLGTLENGKTSIPVDSKTGKPMDLR
jgi:hypothetical protein